MFFPHPPPKPEMKKLREMPLQAVAEGEQQRTYAWWVPCSTANSAETVRRALADSLATAVNTRELVSLLPYDTFEEHIGTHVFLLPATSRPIGGSLKNGKTLKIATGANKPQPRSMRWTGAMLTPDPR